MHHKKICEVNVNYHFDNSCLLQEQWIFICLFCLDFFMKINVFSQIFMLFFKLKTWCLDSKIVRRKKFERVKHEKKGFKKIK